LIQRFGITGDKPDLGDFDGNRKADPAIFRPLPGEWWYQRSPEGRAYAFQFGSTTDKAVAEALEILEEKAFISFLPKKEYVEPMQVGRLGRYKNPAGGMREVWAANGRDAVACAIFEGQRRNNEKKMD
jgi:hypothetical protein